MRTGPFRSEPGKFVLSLACAVLAASAPTLAAPHFVDLFRGFGAALPLPTSLFLSWHGVVWLLPLLVISLGMGFPKARKPGDLSLAVGVGGLLCVVPITVGFLYWPIFQLAYLT